MYFVYRLYPTIGGVFRFGEVSHVKRFVKRSSYIVPPHKITGLRLSECIWIIPGTCKPEEAYDA